MRSFNYAEPSSHKGKTDIWLTPLEIVKACGHFDLDPCGELDHLTADKIYTEKGLESKWKGRIWLNPPYSSVSEWVDKMIDHDNGCLLVFARTETKWAQLVLKKCNAVFFFGKRISFINKYSPEIRGTAAAPTMLLNFGCHFPFELEHKFRGTWFYRE